VLATEGTATVLRRNGIEATVVRKHTEGRAPDGELTVVGLISEGQIDLVVNSPSGQGARADGYEIRAATTAADTPIGTTDAQLAAAGQGAGGGLGGRCGGRSRPEPRPATAARLGAAPAGPPAPADAAPAGAGA